MATSTQTISGVVTTPGGSPVTSGYVQFKLNAPDGDVSSSENLPQMEESVVIGVDGSFTVELWPNTRGYNGTTYSVFIQRVTPTGLVHEKQGNIQVGEDGPYDLADLLAAKVPSTSTVYYSVISQAEYDAAIQAATDAEGYAISAAASASSAASYDPTKRFSTTAAMFASGDTYAPGVYLVAGGAEYEAVASGNWPENAGGQKLKPLGDTLRLSQFKASSGASVSDNTTAMQQWAASGAAHLICDVKIDVAGTATFDPALTWKFSCENKGKITQTANNTNTIYGSGSYAEIVMFEDFALDGKGATDTASCVNGDYFTSSARAIGVLVEKVRDLIFLRCDMRKHKNRGAVGNFIKGFMHVWDCYGIGTHDIGSVDSDIPLGSTSHQQMIFDLGANVSGPTANWRSPDDDPNADEETGVGHNGGGLIVDGLTVGGTAIGVYATPGYRQHIIRNVTILNDYPMSQHPIYVQAGDEGTTIETVRGRGMYGVLVKIAYPGQSRKYPARGIVVNDLAGETQDGSPLLSLEGNDKRYGGYEGDTYASTGAGITGTVDGEMFTVGTTVYLNDSGSAVSQGEYVDPGNGPSSMCAIAPKVSNVHGMGDQTWLVSVRNALGFEITGLSAERGTHMRATVETLYATGTVDGVEVDASGNAVATGYLPIVGDLTLRNIDVGETEYGGYNSTAVSYTEASEAAPIIGSQYWWVDNIGQINNAIYRCVQTGITASKVALGTGTSEQTSGTAKFVYLGDKTTMDRGTLAFDGLKIGYSPSAAYMIDANLSKTTISYDGIDFPTNKQVRLSGILGRRGSYRGGRLVGSLTVVNYKSQEGIYLLSTTAGNYTSAPAWVKAHYWNRGDRLMHPLPIVSGFIGFTCTSSGVGTGSRWAAIKAGPEIDTNGAEI